MTFRIYSDDNKLTNALFSFSEHNGLLFLFYFFCSIYRTHLMKRVVLHTFDIYILLLTLGFSAGELLVLSGIIHLVVEDSPLKMFD